MRSEITTISSSDVAYTVNRYDYSCEVDMTDTAVRLTHSFAYLCTHILSHRFLYKEYSMEHCLYEVGGMKRCHYKVGGMKSCFYEVDSLNLCLYEVGSTKVM